MSDEDDDQPPQVQDLSYHPTNATLWLGEEEEYDDGHGLKLFVDGASAEEIRDALDEYPNVKELYFAHGVEPQLIEEFENQIQITVEVTQMSDVPRNYWGLVNVILRVPSWVDAVKQREGNKIQVEQLDPSMNPNVVWDGKKAYPTDRVIK